MTLNQVNANTERLGLLVQQVANLQSEFMQTAGILPNPSQDANRTTPVSGSEWLQAAMAEQERIIAQLQDIIACQHIIAACFFGEKAVGAVVDAPNGGMSAGASYNG